MFYTYATVRARRLADRLPKISTIPHNYVHKPARGPVTVVTCKLPLLNTCMPGDPTIGPYIDQHAPNLYPFVRRRIARVFVREADKTVHIPDRVPKRSLIIIANNRNRNIFYISLSSNLTYTSTLNGWAARA